MVRVLLAMPLLLGLSGQVAAAPAQAGAPDAQTSLGTGRSKVKVKKRRAVPSTTAAPAGNLNAPSMDFTGVTPETGDAADPRRGPQSNIRPSINSNGQPAMGLGF